MKTQIIKIIPCLVAGFILSACVGAVNLPAGTIAETNAQNTDEPAPEVKIVIITEPESQEVVEIPNACLINPFGDTCTENFATERESVTMKCINDVTGDLCHQAITQVCLDTFSPRLCNKIPTYLDEFKACGYELDSESCAPTITRACHDFENNFGSDFGDVFNLLCEKMIEPETKDIIEPPVKKLVESKPTPPNPCIKNPFLNTCRTDFNAARESVCASEIKSDRCRQTIMQVCRVNPLNALCIGNETYYYPQKKACASERDSDRCASIIMRACDSNSLDSLCNGLMAYYPAQETACAREPFSNRCASTIARVCGEDSLNALCLGNETYYSAQKMTCASEPNSDRCAPTRRRLCRETPFDTVCQSNNLTLYDLPTLPSNRFFFTSGSSPSVVCSRHTPTDLRTYCSGGIPSDIDIKPLNNTNIGTATYAGSVSLEYTGRFISSSRFFTRHVVDNKSIALMVNFDDKTLTYSGWVDSNTFTINGNFTDRGQITGTANFKNIKAPLIGLIGQDEAIGVFASESIAGGFTATRQEPEPETTPNQ